MSRLPMAPGWASEEPWLGGTLYTWPENEPARLIAADEAADGA